MLLSVVLVACKGNVFSLKQGDCFNGALANLQNHSHVTDVELVRCDEPHESEVYASFELPDSVWKGKDYVYNQAVTGCKARFEAFVGIEYEHTTLGINLLYPTEEYWKEMDDRLVTCFLFEDRRASRSGSLRGSRR